MARDTQAQGSSTDLHVRGRDECCSTGEYNGWGKGVDMVDSRYNEDRSPVKNNLEKDFVKGGDGRTGPLRLALNTAQTGRTFQDRSHKFRIVKRPDELPSDVVIHNLNVRGRRGNIVQARTAMGLFDHVRG